ncbi:hypothetical protein H4S01_005225, partial [Coemansia sp. RSA 2610]
MTAENSPHDGKQPAAQPSKPRNVPKEDIPATRLFKVLNPELFMKPNRFIMYGGVVAITGVILWLGTDELKHRQTQAMAGKTNDSTPAQRAPTYQERMSQKKRAS